MTKWQSSGLYEHPVRQKGTYGNIVLSVAGIYCLKIGGSIMSCPQDWAAGIHAEETGQTGSMIIRNIPESLRRGFKSRCAQEVISQQGKIVELMRAYVAGDAAE
jgi:hypothetical protein